VNPYGSAAGAGSGEFHVYRHARSRELERIKSLQEDEVEAQKDAEFNASVEKNRREEMERTDKRRKKRQRQKDAKQRKKNLAKVGVTFQRDFEEGDEDEEDFTYVPGASSSSAAEAVSIRAADKDEPDAARRAERTSPSESADELKPSAKGKERSSPAHPMGSKEGAVGVADAGGVSSGNEDEDDSDDESVGPQPQPKRSKP
jgi:ATPase subunit of ABC transporter with duplicated ATPase domains